MDQLMIGYGVANSGSCQTTPPAYFGDSLVNGQAKLSNQAKKQLTLAEKQEIASKLEQNESNKPASAPLNNSKLVSSNANSKNLTDNLLDKNLVDLGMSNKMPSVGVNNNGVSNYSLLTSMSTTTTSIPNASANTNNLNLLTQNQNRTQQSTIGQSLSLSQMKQSQNTNNINSNAGFFGNLAILPPPSSMSQSSSKSAVGSLNSLMTANLGSPSSTSSYQPVKGSSTSNVFKPMSSSQNNQLDKKSALDDLADFLG
jgi:hypothetical protein